MSNYPSFTIEGRAYLVTFADQTDPGLGRLQIWLRG